AVKLRVSADIVVGVRVQLVAVPVAPDLARVVLRVDVHGARAPVVLLARHEVAALEEEDALAGVRQRERERAAAGPGADDDDVVGVHAAGTGRGARCYARRRRASGIQPRPTSASGTVAWPRSRWLGALIGQWSMRPVTPARPAPAAAASAPTRSRETASAASSTASACAPPR